MVVLERLRLDFIDPFRMTPSKEFVQFADNNLQAGTWKKEYDRKSTKKMNK